ncbi:putative reverse transcriptase domain-containing protein, partial [Tanacetum coccineum]
PAKCWRSSISLNINEIIMANLPPPNNDPNVLEDEHAPTPEHASIAPNLAPIQPNEYLANDEVDPEEEPEEEEEPIPKQALVAPIGFAPQRISGHDPNNNNGWIEEDDKDEVEAEEEDEEEIEDEKDEEMEVEDNDGENDDTEMYNPYEEADPLNRPPPSLEIAEREIMNAPITRNTLQPIPHIRQFSGTFYVGEGSSATVFNPALCKVYPPRPMVNDLNALYSRVKTLTKQMWDRFRVESSSSRRLERNYMRVDSFDDDLTALDSIFREQMQEMKKLVGGLNEQFQQIQERDLKAKNEISRIRLRAAKEKAEYNHMEAKDNAVRADAAGDRGAAIRAERERVREEETRAGGPAGGPAAAPVAQECTFVGFMKCGPTQFHRTEGAVRLSRWFEKMESTFEISECAERRKVKFATATLHGRALTWWNSQVATLGLEVANGKSWTEVKQMMIDEFCPTEEVQRLEDELRHLKLRDMNIAVYTERFNELALLCPDVVPNEKKKVELYIKGLPEIIKGETTSSRPTILNDVVRMTHTLMEQKIQAKYEKIAEGNKRRWENNNQGGNNNCNNNNNNRNNNDNRNNNNNHNNRGNDRDNNRHNQYNQRRPDGTRAMTASQNNVVDKGGPALKCNRYS